MRPPSENHEPEKELTLDMMFLSSFKQVVNKLRLRGLYRANCHTLIRMSTTLSCSEDRYGGVHIQLNQPFETKAFSYSLKGTQFSHLSMFLAKAADAVDH